MTIVVVILCFAEREEVKVSNTGNLTFISIKNNPLRYVYPRFYSKIFQVNAANIVNSNIYKIPTVIS